MNLETGMPTHQDPQAATIRRRDSPHEEREATVPHRVPGPTARRRGSGRVLTFPQPEGDEAMGRVIGGESNRDAIPWNHANPKATHAPGKLRGDHLAGFERDLVAASTEDLVDAAGRLNQVISCQMRVSEGNEEARWAPRASAVRIAGGPLSGGAHPSTGDGGRRENPPGGRQRGPNGMLGSSAPGEVPESG